MTKNNPIMKTFHGDPKLKALLVKEIKWHQDQDKIIQGSYASNGKFCAVGCSIQSLNIKLGKSYSHGDHSVYETELGIPRIIARLEDRLFELMPTEQAMAWPLQFMKAVPVGVDLSLVWPKFSVYLLTDKTHGVLQYAKEKQEKEAIQNVARLYKAVIQGKAVDSSEWRDAAAAAYAAAAYADAAAAAAAYADAAAAAAAYAAADAAAAAAAAAAAYAAADAAAAAYAAADAAAAAAAAAAAYAAADAAAAKQERVIALSKKLLSLIQEVGEK